MLLAVFDGTRLLAVFTLGKRIAPPIGKDVCVPKDGISILIGCVRYGEEILPTFGAIMGVVSGIFDVLLLFVLFLVLLLA